MNGEKLKQKIEEIGEIQVPLKTVVLIVAFTVLIVRPPNTWLITTSQKIHVV